MEVYIVRAKSCSIGISFGSKKSVIDLFKASGRVIPFSEVSFAEISSVPGSTHLIVLAFRQVYRANLRDLYEVCSNHFVCAT